MFITRADTVGVWDEFAGNSSQTIPFPLFRNLEAKYLSIPKQSSRAMQSGAFKDLSRAEYSNAFGRHPNRSNQEKACALDSSALGSQVCICQECCTIAAITLTRICVTPGAGAGAA